jgi:N-acetylglucosaminyl-diphospho-decaprenol L-rhamnosyltransferase
MEWMVCQYHDDLSARFPSVTSYIRLAIARLGVMVLVDVVVVAYNSESSLRSSIEQLARHEQFHVIVVDNASPDSGVTTVSDLDADIVRLRHNRGFAGGCNAGWPRGTAPYVMFLNPDAIILPADILQLVDRLEADSQLAIVGPRIVDEHGRIDPSQRRFPRPLSTLATGVYAHRVFPRSAWTSEIILDPRAYSSFGEPQWISGACMLIRRRVLHDLGGWDEGFFMYSEDVDLCRRARNAGWEIGYDPAATAVHVGGGSASRATLVPALAWSRLRYARKHGTLLQSGLERAAILVETAVRACAPWLPPETRHANARAARLLLGKFRDGSPAQPMSGDGASTQS